MARKVGHVLHDMLEAIERVDQITRGKTFDDFEASQKAKMINDPGKLA